MFRGQEDEEVTDAETTSRRGSGKTKEGCRLEAQGKKEEGSGPLCQIVQRGQAREEEN